MIRAIALLLAGALIGAAARYAFLEPTDRALLQAVATQGSTASERMAAVASGTADFATRHAAVQAAAAIDDTDALREALTEAAQRPPSPGRDIAIESLLWRLCELDAAFAAELAGRIPLPSRFVVQAFQAFAGADLAAALGLLERIDDAPLRRAVAVGLADVVGIDAPGLERVAAALPAAERLAFQAEAIGRLAEHYPQGALHLALRLPDATSQRRAVERIAAAAARLDPRAALGLGGLLPQDLEATYRAILGREWSLVDADGYLAYLAGEVNPPRDLLMGVLTLAATDPDRVLEVADRLSGAIGTSLRSSVLVTLAEHDPADALARLGAVPPGPERDQIVQAIASGYARHDVEAALQWVQQLDPPTPNAVVSVMQQIAQFDPARAIDLMLEQPAAANVPDQLIFSVVLSSAIRTSDGARQTATRLIASDEPRAVDMLATLLGTWSNRDGAAALDWALAHADRLDAVAFGNIAQRLASQDVAMASAQIDRVPSSIRPTWMTRVASSYANQDVAAAVAWLQPFQGQEGYDMAMRQVLRSAMRSDPRAAAQLLDRTPAAVGQGEVSQIAQNWAQLEPAAAASWAQGLGDGVSRGNAIAGVATAWANVDRQAAQRWTLGLPRGEHRDRALSSLVTASLAQGTLDTAVVNAFSSERAMQEAVAMAAPLLASRDAGQARRLLNDYVTSPELRQQAEQRIETMQQTGVSVTSQPLIILN